MDGPSKRPARSPATSRRSACPTSRPSSASRRSRSSSEFGAEDAVDDHRQDRDLGAADRVGEGEVDRGVLERGQGAVEDGLGEGADQLTAAGRELCGPFGIRCGCGAVAFVERVEPVPQAVAEDDRLPTDGFGDRGVLALRIPGHVHPPPEGQRPGVERLRERRLARPDDPGEHDVRRGDHPALVQHPRVVDERPAGVQVLPDEHPGRAEAGFGEERVVPGERRGRVLVFGQLEPAGHPKLGRTGLAARGEIGRRARLCPLGQPSSALLARLRLPGGGLDLRCRTLPSAAIAAALVVRFDQRRGVQALLRVSVAHRVTACAARSARRSCAENHWSGCSAIARSPAVAGRSSATASAGSRSGS